MKTASEQGTPKRASTAEEQAPSEQLKRTSSDSDSGKGKGKGGKSRKAQRHPALRALLWTLKAAIVPILLIAALIGGLYVGYVVIGKAPEGDVWELETWMHMYDLIFSDS